VSLLRWIQGGPEVRLVHRFANSAVERATGLYWDLQKIIAGVETGLRLCAAVAAEGIAAIGVDGWAVDYVRLGADSKPLSDPYCYRDRRNLAAEAAVHRRISRERLYDLSGVQLLPFNTLYQLYADVLNGGDGAAPWVNLPEYVLHYLGGRRVAEYTNATHTQLVALGRQEWNAELFGLLGLDRNAAPPIVPPGTIVGELRGPLSKLGALRHARLIAPACHDTAAAIAGIPAACADWAFISSGTWSLVGTVLPAPCVSAEAREKNYTNLGGVGGNIYFLKNVNGLWLLRQCIEEWQQSGRRWTIPELVSAAEQIVPASELLDVDDPELLQPGGMPARINAQRVRCGAPVFSQAAQDAPAMAALIFHSLAARYAQIVDDLRAITGKRLRRLFVVGGGSKNELLNRLTAVAAGLEIVKGPVESSTIGNLAIQIAALRGAYSASTGAEGEVVAHWAGALGGAYVPEETAEQPAG